MPVRAQLATIKTPARGQSVEDPYRAPGRLRTRVACSEKVSSDAHNKPLVNCRVHSAAKEKSGELDFHIIQSACPQGTVASV